MRGPRIVRRVREGVGFLTDERLLIDSGILVAFSERQGGVSHPPFTSLNLAAHVTDDPGSVDVNRDRLCRALDMDGLRASLTTAEQVHGIRVARVNERDVGAGAMAASGPPPIPGADALFTTVSGAPLMLLYADCVPLVLVATGPTRAVCVVHAGWRGAADGIVAAGVAATVDASDGPPEGLRAYIGPHIRACHYEVGPEVADRFPSQPGFPPSGPAARPPRFTVDLSSAVRESLLECGLRPDRVTDVGVCTAEATDRFYSYRAEGRTGRHAAVAALLDNDPGGAGHNSQVHV